jgi:negative regulator of flagellin synthesis FlgM
MKVSGKASGVGAAQVVTGAKPAGTVQPSGPASPVVPADALSVSGGAQLLAAARAQLAAIPDIRMDKVEAIKAQMDSDNYNPDGEAVADGLVREHTPPAQANGLT